MRTKIFTKLLLFFAFLMVGHNGFSQFWKPDTLYYENFDFQSYRFGLNTNQVGMPKVVRDSIRQLVNGFVVNRIYKGINGYPNAPKQSEAIGGTITMPDSGSYLHIYSEKDRILSKYMGPLYNAKDSSSTNAIHFLDQEFCGIKELELSFFWACEGSETAYGELWYSTDYGIWTRYDKLKKLNNQKSWKREVVKDTAFNNKVSVRFAFRWVNDASKSDEYLLPLMIDEFLVMGSKGTDKVELKVIPKSDIICKGDYVEYQIVHSQMICEYAQYFISLSDEKGNYVSEPIGNFGFGANQTRDTFNFSINYTDPEMVLGDCYKVKIERRELNGSITLVAETGCLKAIDCGQIIRVIEPPYARVDTMGVCVNSAFDVPYNLVGKFDAGNKVIAELSDEKGSFDKPVKLGEISTIDVKSGTNPDNWGWVLGQIPKDTKPGCGYRVRVVSTMPAVVAKDPSPTFCIRQCDIETNEMEDFDICQRTDSEDSLEFSISYKKHTWNKDMVYNEGNEFVVQFLRRDYFFPIFQAPNNIIKVKSTEDGVLSFKVGKYPDLRDRFNMPSGNYYIRVIATDRSSNIDTMGTLIRFNYSASPQKTRTQLIDSILCKPVAGDTTERFSLRILDYDFQGDSEYEFYWGDNPAPQVYPRQYITFDGMVTWTFNGLGVGTTQKYITYRVKEKTGNPNCYPAQSDPDTVWIIDHDPKVDFIGLNTTPCVDEDSLTFVVTKLPGSFYEFSVNNGGQVLTQKGNTATMKFPKEGQYDIRVRVKGPCGGVGELSKRIKVVAAPKVEVTSDKVEICRGDTAILTATGAIDYKWKSGETLGQSFGSVVRAYPIATTTYTVTGLNGNCQNDATITIEVKESPEKPVVVRIPKTDSLSVFQKYTSYQWIFEGEDIPGETKRATLITQEGKYSVRVSNDVGCSSVSFSSNYKPSEIDDKVKAELNLKLFPNPAREVSQLSYYLKKDSDVSIALMDLQGKLITKIVEEAQSAGFQNETINFKNLGVASGSYLITIKVGNLSTQMRISVVD